jgi:hypothetical protein
VHAGDGNPHALRLPEWALPPHHHDDEDNDEDQHDRSYSDEHGRLRILWSLSCASARELTGETSFDVEISSLALRSVRSLSLLGR